MLFKHTAQENKNNPRSSFRFNNNCVPILVECLNSPWRQRVLCGCRRKAKLLFFLLLLGFFFLFARPAAELWVAAAVMEASREGGREAEARRINFSDAQLWRRCHHSQEMKRFNQWHCCFRERRGRGGALDYDSQLYNLERPGDGSTMALALWHLWEAVPSFTSSRHCCALRSLRSLTSMSSTSLKSTMKKKKKTRLWLHCVVL